MAYNSADAGPVVSDIEQCLKKSPTIEMPWISVVICVCINALIAALICSGSSGQTVTISSCSSHREFVCFSMFSGHSVHVCVHVSRIGNRNILKLIYLDMFKHLLWEQEAAGSNPVTPIPVPTKNYIQA